MKKSVSLHLFSNLLLVFWGVAALFAASHAADMPPEPESAQALRAQFEALSPQLKKNQFNRPIYLSSEAAPNQLRGDIYAVLDAPFGAVSQALVDPENWCDVLILHLNIKYCKTRPRNTGKKLLVSVGKKTYEELERITPIEFSFLVSQSAPDFFDILLTAKSGPVGTSDYRITLEAVALKSGGTFLHLHYAYAYNYFGLVAMQTYLATVGRAKVGFTQTYKQPGGTPDYIGGMRGVVERNTMRYYLAIEAYLDALASPSSAQLDLRLVHWFSATERWRRQLHELDLEDYMAMKHQEYARMISLP